MNINNTNSKKGELNTMQYIAKDTRGLLDYYNFQYISAFEKSEVKCLKCGRLIMISPVNLRNGKGCRSCKLSETLQTNKKNKWREFLKECKKRHTEKFDYRNAEYAGALKPIQIICTYHKKIFKQNIHNHLKNDSGGCPVCKKEKLASDRYIHGYSGTKLYNVYSGMIQRCHNSKQPAYKDYGGRRISVCHAWRNNPAEFFKWAEKNGFNESLQIDRINNNKGYSPTNCRFVTSQENSNNTRSNVKYTIAGISRTQADWSRIFRQDPRLVHKRISRGWSIGKALTEPVKKRDPKTPKKEYRLLEGLWSNIKSRCNYPKNEDYKNYGGRGIHMCDEWENYDVFEDWCVKNGWNSGLHLNRIDYDQGYNPGNCNFLTPKENARNKRTNRNLTLGGKKKHFRIGQSILDIIGKQFQPGLIGAGQLKKP